MIPSYTIGAPVVDLPPVLSVNKPRDNWSYAYRAATAAGGQWVPVVFTDRVSARALAAVAKKRRHMESQCRGTTCFLRVTL